MPEFHGTDASETIIGTAGNDIFYSSKGQDILDGGDGYDKLFIDYSQVGTGFYAGGTVRYMFDTAYGRIGLTDAFNTQTDFLRFEEVEIVASATSEHFDIDLTSLGDFKLKIDAGGGTGIDSVYLRGPFIGGPITAALSAGVLTLGNVILIGFENFDIVLSALNDNLTLGSGGDHVNGGNGDDQIFGGGGNDVLIGEFGSDRLDGGEGNDTLFADLDFTYRDPTSVNVLNGGAGDDQLTIGYGDSADGGAGTDTLTLWLREGSTGGVTLDFTALFAGGVMANGGGTISGVERYGTIYGTDFADVFILGEAGHTSSPGTVSIAGYGGNDVITVGSADDIISGGEGNDTIRSGGGDDQLIGDLGNDQLYGEAGNDQLYGDLGDDVAHGGDGNDRIVTGDGAISFTARPATTPSKASAATTSCAAAGATTSTSSG
jgi:Ca2+-binding RTX toxin-like protein